jgi:hypothetical protein
MSVNHYDGSGKKIGSSSDDSGGAVIVVIGIVFGALYGIIEFFSWVTEKITNWSSLDAPYSYMAVFYNYLVLVPISVCGYIRDFLYAQSFTEYPNINLLITLLGIVAYIAFIIAVVVVLIRWLNNFGSGLFLLLTFLLSPVILCVVWYILLASFKWLISTA